MKDTHNIGPLLILVASLIFSTLGTAQALAPEEATPYVLGTIRMLGGGLILLIWCTFRNLLPTRHGWWRIETFACIIGLFGFQVCFFNGILQVGVAIGTVTALGVTPIATGLFCILFLREPFTMRWFFSTLLAIVGLALLTLTKDTSVQSLQGLILAIVSGFFYSAYVIGIKRLLVTHHPETLTMVLALGTGICMVPFVFMFPLAWILTLHGLATSFYFSVVAVALAITILIKGLQTTPAPIAATLFLAEPLGAALLGIFFLGESLSFWSSIGMACMFLAIISLMWPASLKKECP